jgi:hypothetical protein
MPYINFLLIPADFFEKVALKGGRVGVWPSPAIDYI